MGGIDNDQRKTEVASLSGDNNNININNRRNRRIRNRWNNTAVAGNNNNNSKFEGKTTEIKNDIFDNTGPHDAALFHRSLKNIADHLQLIAGNDVSEAIRDMKLIIITIPPPPQPTVDPTSGSTIPVSTIQEYLWKEDHKEAKGKKKKYDDNMQNAFIIILHQCSPALRNDMEAADVFPAIRVSRDPIALLRLIQGLCCSYDSKTQSVMATVASHKKLFTYFQHDGVDNHTYHREFMAHVETIETYGGLGAVGIIPTFLTAKMKELAASGDINDISTPTDAERALAIKLTRDEFLGALLLNGANKIRFSSLKTELSNQYGFGNDLYPKSVDQCLTMLNRRADSKIRPPRAVQPTRETHAQPSETLVFAQGAANRAPNTNYPPNTIAAYSKSSASSVSSGNKSRDKREYTSVRCKTCGQLGHISSVCPNYKPPAQIHAMTNADDASQSSDGDSVLILAQIAESNVLFAQETDRKRIGSDLVLLDSQSTVDLFSNPSLVNHIRPATTPINVHCNKGTLHTSEMADFGNTPVYFDARGIANILSLHRLGQKFRVTYDSTDRGGVFQVHTDGGIVEFNPTEKGLHALNLREDPGAAYLLAQDHVLHVNTVRGNHEGFTKKHIAQASNARRLMGMIGSPSERDFQGLVRQNLLKDCPITNDDIVNAHKLFGPDLASIRGKTVRRKPDHVRTDYVDIPRDLINLNSRVTMIADVMFVNGIPFLVSSSRNINLITIEHAPHRTATKLGFLLDRIVRVYTRAGFTTATIIMDNEFNKVKDHLPQINLNTSAAGEHVGEIERRIRVIKERARGIICTLPYPRLPQIMVIHLLHFIVMWLNNFPVSNSVSARFSPRELILRHKLDAKNHCRAPFGAYCETHEENTPTNSMESRGTPAICLGPTGNIQGSYNFLNLASGLVIKRRKFTELPVPDSVITRVTEIAKNSGVSKDLQFCDRRRQPYPWQENPDLSLDDTPMATYPDIPAELPGILRQRDNHTEAPEVTNIPPDDWEALATAAADNADLDFTDTLPTPPEVIEIDDDDNCPVIPTTPFFPPKVEPDYSNPPMPPTSRYPSRERRAPQRLLNEYHLYTTIADAHKLPPNYPYRTAGRTDIDLALQDDDVMAHICHYVMVHTAESIYSNDTIPSKKHYSLKSGLRKFADRGKEAVRKELTQFHTLRCFRPCDPSTLTRDDRRKALTSLMFLTQKSSGEIKARACANGSVQRDHIAKEEATSPTVTSDAIFIQGTIFAHEGRHVATCDIPGAFLHADNPDYVIMRLDGILAELMVKVEPSIYRKYITTNAKGKPILYVQVEKAVYGMMKSALLFYRKLIADLTSIDFKINPYDPCVANKMVNGKQLTVCWHVDDLFTGHEDPQVVKRFTDWLSARYDTTDKKLQVCNGPRHDYLGMTIDFSTTGTVIFDMIPYLSKIIKTFPEKITGAASSPAADHLFKVRPPSEALLLTEDLATAYHHTTAQLLFLSRVRRDIQSTVAFLTTRVKHPDEDDWGKLKRLLRYLNGTQFLRHSLRADSITNIIWYIDASFQTHDDTHGHTGSILTFGGGATTSSSTKQKLPSKSSTESELIGLYDKCSDVLWTRHFLEAQGYTISSNIVYQDNMSTLSLAKNGYVSSTKRTKHIKAKYFFVRHYHNSGDLELRYCPTEEMWADVLTKPLQGKKFRIFRAMMMNCPVDYVDGLPPFLAAKHPTLSPSTYQKKINNNNNSTLTSPSPMKHQVVPTDLSLRGCVETKSPGSKPVRTSYCPVQNVEVKSPGSKPVRTSYCPVQKQVSWRDVLFPRHIPPVVTE